MGSEVGARLAGGVTVPAHPLALDSEGKPDLLAQRALTRYYAAAGADGLAIGVHTTQFDLHHDRDLLREIWELGAAIALESPRPPMLIAGVCGDVHAAVAEAEMAASTGYTVALLCPWGMADTSEQAQIERAAAVGEILPTVAFYLQESVGGRRLSRAYWARLFDLACVVAVKTAPFDRYRTNDVLQVLLEHDRWDEVVVLTGNDDTIVHDLVTPYRRQAEHNVREIRIRGGLLGQWAVGTRAAVALVAAAREAGQAGAVRDDLLATAPDLVEINAAIFDVAHDFAGCVPGVNEVLRQQGLLGSARCLSSGERLSPGQQDAITAVRSRFPRLLDEEFVADNKHLWLQ